MPRPRFSLPLFGSLATLVAAARETHAGANLPDTFVARVEALASMETLNAELLGSRSATRTLEAWCATHHMAKDARIVAVRVHGEDRAPDDAQRARLQVGAKDAVRHRRVRLTCGDTVLSEADNWYVPSRLTPAMNQLLDTTDAPFGKVVASLQPTRETFSVDTLWRALPSGWELDASRIDEHPDRPLAMPPVLFEHRAVLFDAAHRPFSEVDEHYTRDILSFAPNR